MSQPRVPKVLLITPLILNTLLGYQALIQQQMFVDYLMCASTVLSYDKQVKFLYVRVATHAYILQCW